MLIAAEVSVFSKGSAIAAASPDQALIPDNSILAILLENSDEYLHLEIINGNVTLKRHFGGEQLDDTWVSFTGTLYDGNRIEGTMTLGDTADSVFGIAEHIFSFYPDQSLRQEIYFVKMGDTPVDEMKAERALKAFEGQTMVFNRHWRILEQTGGITQTGNDYQSGPSSLPTDRIPAGVLPVAAGAAAAVAALGALGAAFINGTSPLEIFGELKDFLSGKQIQDPPPSAEGRRPEEIVSSPQLHDQVTDTEGKQWVYYRRPGDTAGDGWTSIEDYQHTVQMEQANLVWSERYGWKTREELAASGQMQQKFEQEELLNKQLEAQNRPWVNTPDYLNPEESRQFAEQVRQAKESLDRETGDILKELVASEKRLKESVERSAPLGKEIELAGKVAGISLELAEETRKMYEEGYWIRNPNNSFTRQGLNLILNPVDSKGVKCEEIVDAKLEQVHQMAIEKFGEGVIVDKVVVEEKSTQAPSRILDHLDRVLVYNHTAIRVVTPDGESYIVDFWKALHQKGSTRGIMQPEKEFINTWKSPHNLGEDYAHYSYRDGRGLLDGNEHTIQRYIDEHGPEEGLKVWQRETMQSIEANPRIPDPDKDAYQKQMQAFVNYLKRDGDKIGF